MVPSRIDAGSTCCGAHVRWHSTVEVFAVEGENETEMLFVGTTHHEDAFILAQPYHRALPVVPPNVEKLITR